MDEWISKQNTLIKVAHERQSTTDHHALVEYDPAVTEYPINSYVLFTSSVGRSDKLLPRHRGPYQVLEKSHSIYVIEIWLMVNEHRRTYIICDPSIMTLPGHLHWPSLSRMSKSSLWNRSTDIVAINSVKARWNSRFVGQDSGSHAIVGSHIKLSCMSTSSTVICESMR